MLIGSMLLDNAHVDRVADTLAPDDFGVPLLGRMFEFITQEVARGHRVSTVSLRPHFEGDEELADYGGLRFLSGLVGTHAAALIDLPEVLRILRDLSDRRRIRAGLRAAAEGIEDLRRPVAEVTAGADAAIQLREAQQARQRGLGDAVGDLIKSFDEPTAGVTCGVIPALDELIGTLRPGTLNIVAGRPGMGKTTVALTYARGAADRGHGVQFFSQEMSVEDLAGKAVCDLSFNLAPDDRVPHTAINKRNPTEHQMRQIQRVREHFDRLPFRIVDEGSMTIGRLRRMVRTEKRRMAAKGQKLELVVVDYLQLVSPDRPIRSIVEAVTEVSKGLKALALDEQVVVIALSQLSRAVEQRPDKRPQLSDLRESGQIEQDADAILFLLREEYYLRAAEPEVGSDKREKWEADLDRVRGVIEFILAKKRLGSVGSATGRFYGPYQAVR